MLTISVVLILLSLVYGQTDQPKHFLKPVDRALWNFGSIGKCMLHYNPIIYNNYGCFCGFGGKYKPVDEIDKCCMLHDKCYDNAVAKKICANTAQAYMNGYKWTCKNSKAVCAVKQDPCPKALCACDVAAVECWSKQPKPLKKKKCIRTKNIETMLPLPNDTQH